jgi:microcystin-dependent protein
MSNNLKINQGIDIDNLNNAYYSAGDIVMISSTGSIPQGWLDCNGQVYNENLYKELKDVLGTYFGGGSAYKIPNLNASSLNDAAQNFPLYPSSIISTNQSYYQNPGDNTSHFHKESFSNNSDLYESAAHAHSTVSTTFNTNSGAMNHTHAISTTAVGLSTNTTSASSSANRSNTGTGSTQVPSSTHSHSIQSVQANAASEPPNSHSHTITANYTNNSATNHQHGINHLLTTQNANHYPLSKSMRFIIKV